MEYMKESPQLMNLGEQLDKNLGEHLYINLGKQMDVNLGKQMDVNLGEHLNINLGEHLATLQDFWEYWGFVPWQNGCFKGVSRQQRFVKGGLLGTVAEYGAWEAIVWECGCQEDRDGLWHSCKAIPEVMTQRYLFLLEQPWSGRKIRSLAWGFKGYVEFYSFWPNFAGEDSVKDLTGLINLALNINNTN